MHRAPFSSTHPPSCNPAFPPAPTHLPPQPLTQLRDPLCTAPRALVEPSQHLDCGLEGKGWSVGGRCRGRTRKCMCVCGCVGVRKRGGGGQVQERWRDVGVTSHEIIVGLKNCKLTICTCNWVSRRLDTSKNAGGDDLLPKPRCFPLVKEAEANGLPSGRDPAAPPPTTSPPPPPLGASVTTCLPPPFRREPSPAAPSVTFPGAAFPPGEDKDVDWFGPKWCGLQTAVRPSCS